jgi:histidyl-tRNA synthetase
VASALRREGIRVDFDADGKSAKAQFRAARRLEAPVILVWKGDGVPVDVQEGETRREMPLEEVPGWLRRA